MKKCEAPSMPQCFAEATAMCPLCGKSFCVQHKQAHDEECIRKAESIGVPTPRMWMYPPQIPTPEFELLGVPIVLYNDAREDTITMHPKVLCKLLARLLFYKDLGGKLSPKEIIVAISDKVELRCTCE